MIFNTENSASKYCHSRGGGNPVSLFYTENRKLFFNNPEANLNIDRIEKKSNETSKTEDTKDKLSDLSARVKQFDLKKNSSLESTNGIQSSIVEKVLEGDKYTTEQKKLMSLMLDRTESLKDKYAIQLNNLATIQSKQEINKLSYEGIEHDVQLELDHLYSMLLKV
jgi:hypothetical protein